MAAAHLDMPFSFDSRGRAATTDTDDHVRDLIKAVLFTAPGERVNRPDFGCGLAKLVFAPLSDALTATTQHLVQASLLRWLGDLIAVESVAVSSDDSTLTIRVAYRLRSTADLQTASFERRLMS